MKLLFTAGGSQATVFGIAPLASAARNAGHEILLATDDPMLATAEAIGLPAVSVTHDRVRYARDGETATTRLDALLSLSRSWHPNVVVGGLSFVPRLLAACLAVPFVRHVWHVVPSANLARKFEQEQQVEMDRLKLTDLPLPALDVDVCPPSLRSRASTDAQPMRWIPRNRQSRIEPWMHERSTGRRRVLVTSGTRTPLLDAGNTTLRHVVVELGKLGAEVVIAAPEAVAAAAGDLGTRVGWIPLDVIAPTCDVAVHHGGATTAATLMNAAVPHVVIPDNGFGRAVGEALTAFGSAVMLNPRVDDLASAIVASCVRLLGDPAYGASARVLADEIAVLPTPSQVLTTIESFAA